MIAPLLSVLLALAPSTGALDSEEEQLGFSRDVRPILSNSCFPCHGPDSSARAARLRLDVGSVVEDDRGVIVPGRPADSELVRRITAADPDLRMPPPDAHLDLTEEEVATLTRWIAEGAEYEEHWAFRPVPAVEAPASETAWARGPIDEFVLAALRERGLEPSEEADRRTLLRRVTFDLTGLPPTPEEIAAFLADDSETAYEKVVERLLSSSAYAERMTLAWMDASRYGDTSVFHADGPRDMWPWRDWVLAAYDGNLPFDRFVVEQLAGDLLPEPTREQRIAAGFLRNNGTSDEGGAIDEELRVSYLIDRVKTTSNVFLGLSMECAQCHEHKYDPISQEDYYRFFAYFNQSVEKGFQTRNGNEAPLVRVPSAEQEEGERALLASIEGLKRELEESATRQAETVAFSSWTAERREELLDLADPVLGPWFSYPPQASASSSEAFRTRFGPEDDADLQRSLASAPWSERPEWEDGRVHEFPAGSNTAHYLARTLEVPRATRRSIALGSDDTLSVWLNGEELLAQESYRGAAPGQNEVALELRAGTNVLLLKVVNGGGPSGFVFELRGLPLPDGVLAALAVDAVDRGAEQTRALAAHYVREIWPPGTELSTRLADTEAELATLRAGIPTVMSMADVAEPRPTYVLSRGQYDAPDEGRPVQPGVLEFLLPERPEAPRNRLGLAEWLVDPRHPLTARVAVNRYWAMLFGTGLVETVMDFGLQGAWPSHAELLDWLARDFVTSGWDVKRMLRQIVTSATYRQSSHARSDAADLDPRNRLLARAPRFRLQGEFLRDQALAVAGLLVDEVGGPGVRPYQPPGLWNEVSLDKNVTFTQGSGDELYRKSMYIYWKRSAPMPVMTTFDAPTRETCVVQRQRTNTPLQALVTLNDVQFVEAARHLAARMLRHADDFRTRLDLGFELCTGRPADELRRQTCSDLLARELERFAQDPDAAAALLAVGDSPADASLDAGEHAAWTVLASLILNLDESLNRD